MAWENDTPFKTNFPFAVRLQQTQLISTQLARGLSKDFQFCNWNIYNRCLCLKQCLRLCLYLIQASGCRDSLGMASGAIPDERISVSSQVDNKHAASLGRLHLVRSGSKRGSWAAGTNDTNQWLQVDLGSIYTRVTGVATQGRNDYPQRVTRYKLQYGNDGTSFQYYRQRGQHRDKVEWF